MSSRPNGGRGGRERRRAEGAVRNAAWQKFTPEQKIVCLDERLGVGVGARRQRKLLSALGTATASKRV